MSHNLTFEDLLTNELRKIINQRFNELRRDTEKSVTLGKRSMQIKVIMDSGTPSEFEIEVGNTYPKEKDKITLKVDPEQGDLFKIA